MSNDNADIRLRIGSEGGSSNGGDLIRKELNSYFKNGIKVKVKLDDIDLGSIKAKIAQQQKGVAASQSELNINRQLEKSFERSAVLNEKISKTYWNGRFKENLKDLTSTNDQLLKMRSYYSQLEKSSASAEALQNKTIQQVAKVSTQATSGLSSFNEYLRTIKPSALGGFTSQIDEIKNHFAAAMNSSGKSAQKALDQANNAVKTLKASFKDMGAEGGNVFTYLHGKLKTFTVYLASSAITIGFVSAFKNAVDVVYDLDKALTNLRIVTNGSRDSAEELIVTYNKMAQALGSTTTAVSESANDWLRQGYSISDTNKLIQDSMVLSIVGQMDSADATDALTAAMKGYQLSVDDVIGVVDKFTGVDMDAATSSSTLAVALSKTAANAKLAGLSLDDVIGQLAVVNETMKEGGEETGTFYNTMLSRMGAIKSGQLVDPESSESLSDVETTLNRLGIKLRDTEDEFRNFGAVLNDVGDDWKNYSSVDQRAIAQAFAGTRQQTRFLSLMAGWKQAQEYSATATNSAGTAMDKFGKYEEGLEAKTNKLTAAFENMSNSIISSGLIGLFLDIGTNALNAGAAFGGLPVQITGVVAALIALVSISNALKKSTMGASFVETFHSIASIIPTLEALGSISGGMVVNNELLVASFAKLTPVKIADIAATQGLEAAELSATLQSAGYTLEQRNEIAVLYMDAQAKAANAAATTAQATATDAASIATGKFASVFKGLGVVLASHPLLTLAGVISMVVFAIVKMANASEEALKKQQELTDTLSQEYSDVSNNLDDLNSKLDDTRSKINELQTKGPLSFTEQEDLKRLKKQNDQLKVQIDLLNEQKKIKADEVNASVKEEYKKTFQMGGSPGQSTVSAYDDGGNYIGEYSTTVDKEVYYQDQIDKLKALLADKNANLEDIDKVKSAIKSVAAEYSTMAQKANTFTEEGQKLYDQMMDLATLGNNAANENFWSDSTTKKFDSIFDLSKYSKVKQSLLDLANQGNLTAESINNSAYEEFITNLKEAGVIGGETGVSLENLVDHINSLSEDTDSATSELGSLADALSNIDSSKGILDSALSDIKNNNSISLDTLQKIVEKYSDLEDQVALYSAGIISASDLLDGVQQKYDDDLQNYGKLIAAKNQYNSQFFSGLLNQNQAWVSEFAKKYGVDLKNYKDLASAKLAIEQELLGKVTSAWKQFYNAQTNTLSEAAYGAAMSASRTWNANTKQWDYTGPITSDQQQTIQAIKAVESYSKAIDALDNISTNFSISGLDFDTGSKSSVEKYIVDIDKFREALQRLDDVTNEISTTKAKMDLVDENDVDALEAYTNKLVALYQEQQSALHSLNNERDTAIQSGVDQLRNIGFDISYDSGSNSLFIKNLELLNQLGSNLDTEAQTKYRKEIEESIKNITDWNKENIDDSLEWLQIQKQINDLLGGSQDRKLDLLKEQKNSLDDIIDLTKDLIKQETDDHIDALEKERDVYKDIIDLKTKSLDLSEKERSYQEKVDDSISSISKLQKQADDLGLDGTREAQLKRTQILEEISDKQKELSDEQRDYSIDNQKDALSEEYDQYSDTLDDKIDDLKAFLNDNERLTAAAYDRIDSDGENLYDKLLAYAKKYTDTSEAQLVSMWKSATAAVNKYGSAVQASTAINSQIDTIENGSNASPDSKSYLVSLMKANSEKWGTADQATKDDLQAENAYYASQIHVNGATPTLDQNTGIWWLNGKKLYDYTFHSGTPSAGQLPTTKQNELWALIEKGEAVLTQKQQNGILSIIEGLASKLNIMEKMSAIVPTVASNNTSSYGDVNFELIINGNVDENLIPVIRKEITSELNKTLTRKNR